MKTKLSFVFTAIVLSVTTLFSTANAQNTSPYWSLAGNNNATAASKLGTTNAFPVRILTNNAERITIMPDGKVGIGITNPINILTVKTGGGTPSSTWTNVSTQLFYGFSEDANGEFNIGTATDVATRRSLIQGKRSRGTIASPQVVQNNDYLASIIASGYDGSAFQNPAEVDFYVDGTPSAGHVPGRISFVTGTNGTDRLERLKVGSTGDFNFNNTQLTIKQATGNVGINTATPSARLSVVNNSSSQALSVISSIANGQIANIQTTTALNAGNDLLQLDLPSNQGTESQFIEASTGGTTTKFAVNSDGRVGIGGTALTGVGCYITKGTDAALASGGYLVTGLNSGANISIDDNEIMARNNGAVSPLYLQNSGGLLALCANSGNVTVGTTTPATGYKVSVNGKIIATEVRVEANSNWPDYVFGKSYNLISLEELEQKIKASNHLPNIPSATEVKENGIMLGEMQTKTIEKVEENTLYIIQLNNKIKQLEKVIDELTKKIK